LLYAVGMSTSLWQTDDDTAAVVVARREGVARVTLNRPDRLNALDLDSSRLFRDRLVELAADDSVRCVLLTGAGRAFSAGADVTDSFDDRTARSRVAQDMRDVTSPTILTLREMPKPVIAAVNGAAAGVGCSFALACDLVLAAESAYFLLAFANLALTVDGGASLLVPARVGIGRAFVMALLAERLAASEAVDWGLADRVVPDVELAPVAEALALRLGAGPTGAYAATKRLVNEAQLAALPAALAREADEQSARLDSAEFDAAVVAFQQRRR
jgi:2-(1,2-epoxy-1,2-dihydrophenyl)acetyl-CoA isomerase